MDASLFSRTLNPRNGWRRQRSVEKRPLIGYGRGGEWREPDVFFCKKIAEEI